MEIILSDKVKSKLRGLRVKNAQLTRKVYKQLDLFMTNPHHPSLRLHKLVGNLGDSWSISVDRSTRMVYTLTPEGAAYFYKLGTHDEVYQK